MRVEWIQNELKMTVEWALNSPRSSSQVDRASRMLLRLLTRHNLREASRSLWSGFVNCLQYNSRRVKELKGPQAIRLSKLIQAHLELLWYLDSPCTSASLFTFQHKSQERQECCCRDWHDTIWGGLSRHPGQICELPTKQVKRVSRIWKVRNIFVCIDWFKPMWSYYDVQISPFTSGLLFSFHHKSQAPYESMQGRSQRA